MRRSLFGGLCRTLGGGVDKDVFFGWYLEEWLS